jgi:HPt (histidine-containing phosphotransfer) domain-containing protein
MAPPKKHSAAVATYGDHEVILPEDKLRKLVTATPMLPGEDNPVARVELALAELSTEFSSWMDTECERLDQARRNSAAGGFNALFRTAHDIKGEAATFGFPLVAWAADSLCRLLEHTPDANRIPIKLVDQHADGGHRMGNELRMGKMKDFSLLSACRFPDMAKSFPVILRSE